MNRGVAMHLHSSYSDGSQSPEKLVEQAKKAGVGAAALRDHDTIEGINKFLFLAKGAGLEVISGLEFFGCWESPSGNRHSIHFLVYVYKEQSVEGIMAGLEKNRRVLQRSFDLALSLIEEYFSIKINRAR